MSSLEAPIQSPPLPVLSPVRGCDRVQTETSPAAAVRTTPPSGLTCSSVARPIRVQVARKPRHTGRESVWGVLREWGRRCIRASPGGRCQDRGWQIGREELPRRVPIARETSRESRESLQGEDEEQRIGRERGRACLCLPCRSGTAATVARPTWGQGGHRGGVEQSLPGR